jgi:23S rRNA pseudouridine2605 synthase
LIYINLSSRREAERLIRSGSVKLAGETITIPQRLLSKYDYKNGALTLHDKALHITTTTTTISHDDDTNPNHKNSVGMQPSQHPRVWIVNKLSGELVTENDPLNRPSLFDRLRKAGIHKVTKSSDYLKPIGRLDMNTEGLILLTSCGLYSREMELPVNSIHRVYRVRVHGILNQSKIQQIQRGKVMIDGIRYKPMKITIDERDAIQRKQQRITNNLRRRRHTNDMDSRNQTYHTTSTNYWIQITCREGKNRQIRNVLKYLGCKYY